MQNRVEDGDLPYGGGVGRWYGVGDAFLLVGWISVRGNWSLIE